MESKNWFVIHESQTLNSNPGYVEVSARPKKYVSTSLKKPVK